MIDLDCLKQKLMENYGMSAKEADYAINKRYTSMVLETLMKENGLLEQLVVPFVKKCESDMREAQNEARDIRARIRHRECVLVENEKKLEAERKEIEALAQELKGLQENLTEAETPEMRDRLRAYNIFKQDVKLKTPQNNSVYIAGLASILNLNGKE